MSINSLNQLPDDLRISYQSVPALSLLLVGADAVAIGARIGQQSETARDVADALGRVRHGARYAAILADAALAAELAESGIDTFAIVAPDGEDAAEAALAAGACDVVAADAARGEIERIIRGAAAAAGVAETSAMTGARLAELSAEVAKIARALDGLARTDTTATESSAPPVNAGYLRSVIRARRARAHFFPSDLFADPAWDILLDLMASRLEDKRVSVSSLCIAAAVPPTTALRWIKSMTDAGLLERRADPIDGRRIFIDLSDQAAAKMAAYLAQAARAGTAI